MSASRRAATYPRERPCTHCTGGWVGLTAGLDRCGKSRLHRDSIPGASSPCFMLITYNYGGMVKVIGVHGVQGVHGVHGVHGVSNGK